MDPMGRRELPLPKQLEGRRTEIFPALTPLQLSRMAAFGIEERVPDGHVFYEPGRVGVPLFVVLEGAVEIIQLDPHAPSRVIVLGTNEFTGEANLIKMGPAIVWARARGPTRVLRIEPARLQALRLRDRRRCRDARLARRRRLQG